MSYFEIVKSKYWKNDILDKNVGATKVIVINPRWTMDAEYLSHPSCNDYYFSIKFIYFSL